MIQSRKPTILWTQVHQVGRVRFKYQGYCCQQYLSILSNTTQWVPDTMAPTPPGDVRYKQHGGRGSPARARHTMFIQILILVGLVLVGLVFVGLVLAGLVLVGLVLVGLLLVGWVSVGLVLVGLVLVGWVLVGLILVGLVTVGLVINGMVFVGLVLAGLASSVSIGLVWYLHQP